MGGLRVWVLGLVCAALWALGGLAPSRVAGGDAPSTEFSAVRAQAVLSRLLGPQLPHPVGSAQDAALHARLLGELARLGVPARTVTGMGCFSRAAFVSCGTVSNVIAQAVPGRGKAVLLMAHLDSVPAGPGASDDGAGVATVLETIRALQAGGGAAHPVLALFSDGEEAGLLGAGLALRDPEIRSRVGVVINAEARGTSGPSYLFQTSAANSALVDVYARNAVHPATSSLYGEIYKYLPNDTDLTPFLRAGYSGANFAFIGNVAAYHTPLDRLEALAPATLQSQGDNVLGLARGLANAEMPNANPASLKSSTAMDFDVLGWWLPRLPQSFAVPLALLVFALIALAAWLTPAGRPQPRRPLSAFLMPPLLLLGAVAAGFALSSLASSISGNADPAFAHPLALRIALAFALWALALMTMEGASAFCCWLWLAGLGVGSAIFAPGLSPYFTFPGAVAALLLLLTPGAGRGAALFLAALAMMTVWLGLTSSTEPLMGLLAHPLFMVTGAVALIALLPVLAAQKMGEGFWRFSVIVSLLVSLGAAVVAGGQPAFSAAQPQRLNLRYVEKDGKSVLLADPVEKLPQAMRAAFSPEPQDLAGLRGYVAPMGFVQYPAPSATVTRQGDAVILDLHGSPQASGMALLLPGGLRAITIGGVRTSLPAGAVVFNCVTPDCASAHLELEFSGAIPASLVLAELRHGLPPKAGALMRTRPDWSVPSGSGDVTFVAADVAL